jgi:hypothetical protein
MEGRPGSQVGVYGSACASIILGLDRDDPVARAAVQDLATFVGSARAQPELGHNIKLAMVCLALAPTPGAEATPEMQQHLATLLDRYSNADGLWPAYSRPAQFSQIHFIERPSEVASSVIVVLVNEVCRRLTHQVHVGLRGQVEAVLKSTADSLENAHDSKRTLAVRYGSLIATAIVVIKGRKARGSVRSAYKDAVQKRDFADRRVFFYDCLRPDNGSPSRDYFILPAAIMLPLVARVPGAAAMQRALALEAGQSLLDKLDDDGVFKGGQDLPSTVEQGVAALALNAFVSGLETRGICVKCAEAWLYMTQPSPSGKPTKLVTSLVVILWAAAAAITVGKYIPETWRAAHGLGPLLRMVFTFSQEAPDAAAQFLPFLAAALPASRSTFMRMIRAEPT